MWLYVITDWLGLVPIAVMIVFAGVGLFQWIKRKSILKVDRSILLLGAFYILVFLAYILFEFLVINYRPVLINGRLEASYPSSTTMLVLCIMTTAMMQINRTIKNNTLKRTLNFIIILFILFMVVGRLITNPNVKNGFEELLALLDEMDFTFGTYLWDPRYKGLDDYLWEGKLQKVRN